MRKAPILIILFVMPALAMAQRWQLSGEVFYGTFKMKSMKEYQANVQALNHPFQSQIVDEFPGFVGYNLLTGYNISKRVNLGLRFQYVSTGGRVDYGDYSGRITNDQLLHAYSLGINSTVRVSSASNWQCFLSFTAGTMETSLTLSNTSQTSVGEYTFGNDFSSHNYFFNPAVKVGRKLGDQLMLYATAGYEFQYHRTLRSPENDKAYLKAGAEDVIAEWDGMRLGIGVAYQFGKRSQSE